ncbi:MAG TPA: lipopolysaccharide kinase InaA family protein [Thermoanaerobaculia bacterium]|nr:lipopolysaccharide kinase InaA family protein [Thermoanaerobaculia bacterium]
MNELATLPRPTADGWERFVVGDVESYCRADFREVLEQTYLRHPWVYDALIDCPRTSLFRGRKPVAAGELGGRQVVVKRIFHGGLFAPIARDAFITPGRARRHLDLAEYLSKHGVSTPPVLFASWRRKLGLIRCEVGFERIEGAIDADRFFFGGERPPDNWEERAADLGVMVASLHRIHFLHADLNLMNFLFGSSGQTYILDLDKSFPPLRPPTGRERARNLERLERSIRKQGRHHRPALVENIIQKMLSSYRAALAVLPGLMAAEVLRLADAALIAAKFPPV